MVNLTYLKAIKILYSKLSDAGIERYITGKTNLSLQGIKIKPSHLWILIHDTDLDKFCKLFSDYERSEIIELENGEAKEFVMKIDDVDVMVCAEYQHGTYWVVMKNPILILIGNMRIPCFSLESDRDAYIRLGMLNKAEIINKHLNRQ